jgi:hypothetical protein
MFIRFNLQNYFYLIGIQFLFHIINFIISNYFLYLGHLLNEDPNLHLISKKNLTYFLNHLFFDIFL